MIILGINSSHNATASLLRDGKIIACISEERLTRIKNQSGLPVLAVKECLKIAGVSIDDVDYLVLNFLDPKINSSFHMFQTDRGKSPESNQKNSKKITSYLWSLKEQLLTYVPQSRYIIDKTLDLSYKFFVDQKLERKVYEEIESKLGIPKSKILKAEHHNAHGYAAYYSSPLNKLGKVLIFTLDSSGDGLCATVSIAVKDKIKRISESPSGASLSDLYLQTTVFLGMKPVEHEHKVMGLAPYSDQKYFTSALNKLKGLIWVNEDLTFGTKIHSHMFYKLLPKLFAYERFDNIAAAVQKYTEDIVCDWIKLAIVKTGISDIVCGGGTFMNVKVNQRILEMKEVNSLYVMPSAADESTAIGAAFWAYQNQKNNNKKIPEIQNMENLYLGAGFSDQEIEAILKQKKYSKFIISKPVDIESKIASLLANGTIVARFFGRSEWGARALGNRSILAHPSKLEVVAEINSQIKSRDFWMPFAPSIMEEDQNKYFINRKKTMAPYMIMAFDSTEEGKENLKSAMHQYDYTLRPQVVYKNWNPSYHKIISEFKKQTGIGALLNTSFNLHGFPIVYSPQDALYVFANSGLKFLALGPYLVSKRIPTPRARL